MGAGRVRRTFSPAFIALMFVGLVIGWLVAMSLGPWPTTLSLVPKCSLEMIVRDANNAAVPDAIVEITYLSRLYMGETDAAGRHTWSFPCKGDAQSRLVVDAPGYETYELQNPSQAANPLKIALKALVPPHAPPIVKESDNETLFDENVMVVKVPSGERVTLKVFDLWKGPGDAVPECAKAYLRFTWIVPEPYPDGREDLAVETMIPMGNGRTEVIGSGATGTASTGWCNEITLFNSSLQDYRVEIRYAAGMMEH
jgi:hypothetical protein